MLSPAGHQTITGRQAMRVFINDQQREVATGVTVAELLAALELPPRQVAIEVNRELLPRDRHERHTLAEGDRLEVVTLVGGG